MSLSTSPAIVSAFPQENDLLYINPSGGVYRVNGEIVKVDYAGTAGFLIPVDSVITKVHESRVLSHVANTETGETATPTWYQSEKARLEQNRGEDGWNSIHDRHAYELFTATWTPAYKYVTEESTVLLQTVGEPPVKHPYIHALRKVGGDLSNTLYQYSPSKHAVALTSELFRAAGWHEMHDKPPTFGNPKDIDHTFWIGDTLEFAQMFAPNLRINYLTINIPTLKQYERSRTLTGTFDELKIKHDATEQTVKMSVKSYLNKDISLRQAGMNVGELLSDLFAIKANVGKVSSMKITRSEHTSAVKAIADLIVKVQRLVAEK